MARRGSYERMAACARLLLEAGADASAVDESGSTALQALLLGNCNPAVVRALLEAGADVSVATMVARAGREEPSRCLGMALTTYV